MGHVVGQGVLEAKPARRTARLAAHTRGRTSPWETVADRTWGMPRPEARRIPRENFAPASFSCRHRGRFIGRTSLRQSGQFPAALRVDWSVPGRSQGVKERAILGSREFFLKKAIGWALRQYTWTDPREVARYVRVNAGRLSPERPRGAEERAHWADAGPRRGLSSSSTARAAAAGSARRPSRVSLDRCLPRRSFTTRRDLLLTPIA
jgi:hypothetical protein